MKAFDTDILTEILAGNPAYADRIASVPVPEQAVPIVAVEEILRGRLNAIRQAKPVRPKSQSNKRINSSNRRSTHFAN
jgi:predicted nucleic acid-binding protein